MTTYWITGTSGDWSTAADWVSGVVPGSTDDAVINGSNSFGTTVYAVTVNGTAVAHSLTLNSSTLTDSGTLTLGTLTLNGTSSGGALLTLNGGTLSAQSITTDIGTSGGLFGYGTVIGAVSGNVFIVADGGALKVQGSLSGDQSWFEINSGATLELSSGTAQSGLFSGLGMLKLDTPTAFTGSIGNIVVGDTIDLAGIIASSATYSGSTLTINETNGQQLTYNNVIGTGSLAGHIVAVASDNNGGTLVYWTQTPDTWITGTAGDWSTAADWVSGVVPGSTDDAVLNNSTAVTVYGMAVAHSLTLNSSTLTDSGALTLGTSLTMDGGSQLLLSGGTLSAQSITSDNNGQLSGYGTAIGAVSGDINITAAGGTLKVQGSLAADTGSINIASGATLELNNSTAAAVAFAGTSATLKLDAPAAFTGAINNIVIGDTIDLAGIAASSATYGQNLVGHGFGGTLTINETNGQQLTYNNLFVAGYYNGNGTLAGYEVTVASDNNGGTLVYWTQTPDTWITGTAGDWSTAADWSLGVVPTSATDAVINNSNTVTVNGTAVAHSLTLNSSTLTDIGSLTLGALILNGPPGSNAQLTLDGGMLSAQSITTGSGINYGIISGYGTVIGTVTGAVDLFAQGGVLKVQGSFADLRIESAATVELINGNATEVTFEGSSGTLKLDAPTAFTGGMLGFGVGETIDLAGITASSATYSINNGGGRFSSAMLTINENNGQQLTYIIDATGSNVAGDTLKVASDANGGTLVYWTTQMATYSYITVDSPSSSPEDLTGINNAGQFVGNFFDGTIFHGFLYSGGVYTTIDDPVGTASTTNANGINNLGQIVGSYSNSIFTHGFLYSGGTYTTLNDPLAGPNGNTIATGINDSGQIVGSYLDSSNHTHGFLYSGGVYTTIDDPSVNITNGFTQAIGINNAGQIVGAYSATSGDYGFLYSNGTYTTLQDPLAGANNLTIATGINNQGQIVGNYSYGHGYNGFIYSNGTYTTIDDPLAPAGLTQVNGINDLGEVVGIFRNSLDATNPLPPGHGFFAFDAPQLPPTSVQQEIAGLYAVVTDRAADSLGMSYWVNVVAQQPDALGATANTPISTNDAALLGELSVGTQNPYFNQTYGNLNDAQFVDALYLNLGEQHAGLLSAISYWVSVIQYAEASGLSGQNARGLVVGEFVDDLIDTNPAQWTSILTPSQLELAILRQAFVDNKLAVSLAYVNASANPGGSILDSHVAGDAASQAEVRALVGVGVNTSSVTAQIDNIGLAVSNQNLAEIQPYGMQTQPLYISSLFGVADTGGTDVNVGHLVTLIMTTSEAVTVIGTPTLQLNDNEVAFYTGGSGTNTLTFTYAVQFGDNVADLQVTSLNLLSGAAIADQAGNALSGSVTGDLGLQIDTTIVPATSVQQQVLGLYAVLYDRAAEFPGLSYWVGLVGQQPDAAGVTLANASSTAVTLNDAQVLGQAFVNDESTFFNQTYGGMSDSAFINALYVNIGGNAGDPGGIAYWTGLLQQTEGPNPTATQIQAARAGLVGEFVQDFIDVNLSTIPGLTPAQFTAAVQRQDTLDNKVAVSLAYSNASQQANGAILVPHTIGDAAYQAAIAVLQGVTYDPATVTTAIVGINNAVAHQDLHFI